MSTPSKSPIKWTRVILGVLLIILIVLLGAFIFILAGFILAAT